MRNFFCAGLLMVLVACNAGEAPPSAPAAMPAPAAKPPALRSPSPEGEGGTAAKRVVLFNTPEADAVLSTLPIFPKDNPWNEDISDRPVHPDSGKIINSIGGNLRFRWNLDMPFQIVPA